MTNVTLFFRPNPRLRLTGSSNGFQIIDSRTRSMVMERKLFLPASADQRGFQGCPLSASTDEAVVAPVAFGEVIERSNIWLFVLRTKAHILYIWDDSQRKVVGHLTMNPPITLVRANRNAILVRNSTTTRIYRMPDLVLVSTHSIQNPNGLTETNGDIAVTTQL